MRIIIVGAGKVGWALTQHLSAENRVTVIDQNDEYAIVEPDDTYGLREYDFIVLDASTMSPDEFVYQ